MTRLSTRSWLTVALCVFGASCMPDTLSPTQASPASVLPSTASADRSSADRDDQDDAENAPVSYAVIGDVPYEPRTPSALSVFPTLINSINADPDVRRAVHIGDIKSGSTLCSDTWFQQIAASFATFTDPLIYTPGDNEWTDCHRANNGGYNPLNRLAKVRQLFFAEPRRTLGANPVRVKAQRGYPENVTWEAAQVVLATFHVIGSNNGRDPWFGDRKDTTSLNPLVTVPKPETAAEGASREAEYLARNAANIKWLDRLFDEAQEERAKGVVLFLQADMWHPSDRAGGAKFDAHLAFLTRLAALATRFGKPVLIVCGDSHDFRVDVGVPWFSLYGLTPVPNITQLTVDRSIEADIDWLKLTIDPTSPTVFSWKQVFVP
ncbi:MAG: hypothetical protein K2R93_13035 [Gemmatimonadaceae bacterium]|nr:hypothetical protein [Gemmatimonadaceae bacterium]